jgi:hypothetical protein
MYITIVDPAKSGNRPSVAEFENLNDAYEQFALLSKAIAYVGKVPSIGEVRGGFDYDSCMGFRVRNNTASVMIFKVVAPASM